MENCLGSDLAIQTPTAFYLKMNGRLQEGIVASILERVEEGLDRKVGDSADIGGTLKARLQWAVLATK